MSAHLGERLSALLDGELSAGERAEAQVHLRECPACAQQLEELAVVDALARDVPVEAPAGYFDALPGRVRTRLRGRPRARRAPLAVWAAVAAAVVMVAVVVPRVRHQAPPPTPAFAPATVQSKAAAEAAGAPAIAAASVPPPADALRKSNAVGVENDRDLAPAQARGKERLARAAPATSAPAAPAREEAERGAARDDARLGAVAQATPAEAAPAAAPAPATPPGYAAAPPGAPHAAGAPSTRDTVASMQEQKSEDAPDRDSAGAARPMAEARKEAVQGRRLRGDERYEVLVARRPASPAEARDLARAWEAFARDLPGDRHADEARVRAVESLATAWRLGQAAEDLAGARAAARSYLASGNAPQGARVRALLDHLPPSP